MFALSTKAMAALKSPARLLVSAAVSLIAQVIVSQISLSVSLVDQIGSPVEGNSMLDATSESPALFVEGMLLHHSFCGHSITIRMAGGKRPGFQKFSVPSSGCLKIWIRVASRCNGLHYM